MSAIVQMACDLQRAGGRADGVSGRTRRAGFGSDAGGAADANHRTVRWAGAAQRTTAMRVLAAVLATESQGFAQLRGRVYRVQLDREAVP